MMFCDVETESNNIHLNEVIWKENKYDIMLEMHYTIFLKIFNVF